MGRVHFVRSKGTRSQKVQARIHGMGKIWPQVLALPPHYVIEVISERYDDLSVQEKEKIISKSSEGLP